MPSYEIVSVDESNVDELGFFCVTSKKHVGYAAKRSWLEKRFSEGMRIKLILTDDGARAGFIEYIPGKYTWRTVHASDFMVIHCIWVKSGKFPFKGMGTALLDSCIQDARQDGLKGVAVVASDDSWLTGKEFFLKNGFTQVDEAIPSFQLLTKEFEPAKQPYFPTDFEKRLEQYKGLSLIYTFQCPYIAKAVLELPPVAEKYGVDLNLIELKTAAAVRKKMPTPYGMVCLVNDGKILADHYISSTRFKNILERDLKLSL